MRDTFHGQNGKGLESKPGETGRIADRFSQPIMQLFYIKGNPLAINLAAKDFDIYVLARIHLNPTR